MIVVVLVKEEVLNVVMGVNDDFYEFGKYYLFMVVFCIMNCLVLVVKVIYEGLGIKYGVIIIIYDNINI